MKTSLNETDSENVRFHRTAEGHFAARVDDRAMIAVPHAGGGLSVWSACRIDKEPEQWTFADFFIAGARVADEDGFRAHVFEIARHRAELARFPRPRVANASYTPWGSSQDSRRYGDGIIFHATASHGGFELDEAARSKVHPAWGATSCFFEEDVEWAIVAFFTAYECEGADETLRNWRPDAYEKITGAALKPGESHVKDRRRFEADHAGDWVVISAIGSQHQPGFVKCISALGGDYTSERRRRFLVPQPEYASARFGFVIDPERHRPYDGPSDLVGF